MDDKTTTTHSCPLADRTCAPCKGDSQPLAGDELRALYSQVAGWRLVDDARLRKTFKFPNFALALEFVNRVGEIAERQGHHPDIHLAWGKADIELYTHKIRGLSESDFILAARIDAITAPDQ